MTLQLATRLNGNPRGMVELEPPDSECEGRMLLEEKTYRRLGLEFPMPTCGEEVQMA